jgi:hypothetical protein
MSFESGSKENLLKLIYYLTPFLFLSRFKKLNILGIIQAEMWETIQEDAQNIIASVKDAAIIANSLTARLMARIGGWDSQIPIDVQHREMNKIKSSLTTLGASPKVILDISEDYYNILAKLLLKPLRMWVKSLIKEMDASSTAYSEREFPKIVKDTTEPRYQKLESFRKMMATFNRAWDSLHLSNYLEIYSQIDGFIESNLFSEEQKCYLRQKFTEELKALDLLQNSQQDTGEAVDLAKQHAEKDSFTLTDSEKKLFSDKFLS